MSEEVKRAELPKSFTIVRSQWLRGEGGHPSMLYRPEDGKRCCVGFFGNACGISDEQMSSGRNVALTTHLPWPEEVLVKNEYPEHDEYDDRMGFIYSDNDHEYTTDEHKEKEIKRRFSEQFGVEVIFVD